MTRAATLRAWILSVAALLAATVAMLLTRTRLDKAHVTLVFLIVVLIGSANGGRLLGVVLSVASFALFNWFFLEPYYTLALHDPLDWVILFAFLATGLVAAQLFHHAQEQTRAALSRAMEVDRLATLGAETLKAPRALDALNAVADAIRRSLNVDSCELHPRNRIPEGSLVHSVLASGNTALEHRDGSTRILHGEPGIADLRASDGGGIVAITMPLSARDRTVGVLRVADRRPMTLSGEQVRFLLTLSHYASLAVERALLAEDAERAEVLRETNRLKDALLASVSHDLRTPLTSIKGTGARPVAERRRTRRNNRAGGRQAQQNGGRPAGSLAPERGRASNAH